MRAGGEDAAEGDVFLFIFRDFFFSFWMCVYASAHNCKDILADWEILFCFEENNTLSYTLVKNKDEF